MHLFFSHNIELLFLLDGIATLSGWTCRTFIDVVIAELAMVAVS